MTLFYPPEATIPEGTLTDRVRLRPLRATDVERDYEAVMSSPLMLRQWSLSGWPSDDFSLAENLEDLRRHEAEHERREAFTFTVLDPNGSRCLGCAYLAPLWPREREIGAGASYPARVSYWVRESEIARDLDRHILQTLCAWLQADWRFDGLTFTVSQANDRQTHLLQEARLAQKAAFHSPDGRGPWLAFRYEP